MPALRSLPDHFSVQGCERPEGAKMPSKRRQGAKGAGDAFGLPLFTSKLAGGVRVDAPGRVRRPSPLAGRLSIGHNPTISESKSLTKPERAKNECSVWKGAARADTPGIPNRGFVETKARKPSKRGKVTGYSDSSRRNLKAKLATVRTDVELYTMALTLPGYIEHFRHDRVKFAFLRLLDHLAAKSQRDPLFAGVSGFWKQEFQDRKNSADHYALHYHMLFAGITDENLAAVWSWIGERWMDLIFAIPGMPSELREHEREKMSKVHFHVKNFERIRGNFHGYFSKYLGKAETHLESEQPVRGRWWGLFNQDAVPFGERFNLVLPDRVAVFAHRVVRKIRQKRADEAKHRFVSEKWGLMRMSGDNKGSPVISQFSLLHSHGFLKPLMVHTPDDLKKWDGKIPRFGRYRFSPVMKFSPIRLVGKHVPEMYVRILQYAGQRALDERERTPF